MSAMWSWKRAAGVTYYRSKETIPIIHPFVGGGYLSNKKWPLNEGITLIQYILYDIFPRNSENSTLLKLLN